MLNSLIIGVGGVVVMMLGWLLVQTLWGKTFEEYLSDEDVMAGRTKCSNCGCSTICEKKSKQVTTE